MLNAECLLKENMDSVFAFFGIIHIDNDIETKRQKQPTTVKQIKHRAHESLSYGIAVVVVVVDVIRYLT